MTAPGSSSTTPVVTVRGLRKRFGGVQALAGVDLEIRPGRILGLCGENGAGKSTLIKILAGVHPAGSYGGTVAIDGQPVAFRSAREALARGISVVHQELALVPELTIAENLLLGHAPQRHGIIDWATTRRTAQELLGRLGVALDPERRVRTLGVGQQQLVEIARALGHQARVLILDEPTAALTTREAVRLLQLMRRLSEQGLALVFVSHRLEEVFAIADEITVLRDGASVATWPARATSANAVIAAMVGRETAARPPRQAATPGEVLLAVEDVCVDPPPGATVRLEHLSWQVRAGEILGIGGLVGAGRSELLLHLIGAWGRRRQGTVRLAGTVLTARSPREALAQGIALVSEDRKRLGLVARQSVAFNASLSALPRWTSLLGLIDEAPLEQAVQGQVDALAIRTAGVQTPVGWLSGGNQQKVVLAKGLLARPRVLLLDEPTRGVDVGAKAEIHELIVRLATNGVAVVVVSSELPELLSLSDRIVMLGGGRQGGEFTRLEATPERLMAAAIQATTAAGVASPTARDEATRVVTPGLAPGSAGPVPTPPTFPMRGTPTPGSRTPPTGRPR